MPPRSVAPATPPSGAGSPQTRGAGVDHDRLFGTFAAERDDLPCRYGLVTPLRSNNPIIIAFHEWAALAADLWRACSWRERLACLIGPPNWRPARPSVAPSAARDPDHAVGTAAPCRRETAPARALIAPAQVRGRFASDNAQYP